MPSNKNIYVCYIFFDNFDILIVSIVENYKIINPNKIILINNSRNLSKKNIEEGLSQHIDLNKILIINNHLRSKYPVTDHSYGMRTLQNEIKKNIKIEKGSRILLLDPDIFLLNSNCLSLLEAGLKNNSAQNTQNNRYVVTGWPFTKHRKMINRASVHLIYAAKEDFVKLDLSSSHFYRIISNYLEKILPFFFKTKSFDPGYRIRIPLDSYHLRPLVEKSIVTTLNKKLIESSYKRIDSLFLYRRTVSQIYSHFILEKKFELFIKDLSFLPNDFSSDILSDTNGKILGFHLRMTQFKKNDKKQFTNISNIKKLINRIC